MSGRCGVVVLGPWEPQKHDGVGKDQSVGGAESSLRCPGRSGCTEDVARGKGSECTGPRTEQVEMSMDQEENPTRVWAGHGPRGGLDTGVDGSSD